MATLGRNLGALRRLTLTSTSMSARVIRSRAISTTAPKAGGDGYWQYRGVKQGYPQWRKNLSKFFWTATYGWIFWHFFTEYEGFFFGHHPMPDPTKWTDKELGIPADVE